MVAARPRKVLKQLRECNSLLTKFLNMFKILHDVPTPHQIGTIIVRPLTGPLPPPYGPVLPPHGNTLWDELITILPKM